MSRLSNFVRGLFARSNVDRALTRAIKQPIGYRPNQHHRPRVMPGMDPSKLARILRDADNGCYEDYLIAAAELEERDGQYGPQIAVRRTAVKALELTVHGPNGTTARARRAAQDLIDSGAIKPFIHEALDALGKGFNISEIVWVERHGKWVPTCIKHDPREFKWLDTAEEWRLNDYSYTGQELTRFKWMIHEPHLRAGIPIRGGLARPAMFLHMLKSMSLAGWGMLMNIYGVPLAIATPPQDMSDADNAVLRTALAGLGSGINAIIPYGTDIDIIKAADAGSQPERVFSVLLDYVDAQMSKLVLGQTMTADNGSSHAQASVHNEVRKDIREGDAEALSATINECLVRPYIDFNVGPQKVYPEVYFSQPDGRDLSEWMTALDKAMAHGLPVRADDLYAAFGLTKPVESDAVVGRAGPARAPAAGQAAPSEALSVGHRYAVQRRRPPVRQLGTRRSAGLD